MKKVSDSFFTFLRTSVCSICYIGEKPTSMARPVQLNQKMGSMYRIQHRVDDNCMPPTSDKRYGLRAWREKLKSVEG